MMKKEEFNIQKFKKKFNKNKNKIKIIKLLLINNK